MSDLEAEALRRKEKLKALRNKRTGNQDEEVGNVESEKPTLKFRSYNPQTETLKESKLPKAKPVEVEPHIQESLESAKETDIEDVSLMNLAPRKVDWDLKRDITKKLEKLERRTQRAIVEIVQSRLASEKDGDVDLAAVVATAGREQYDSD